MTRAFRFGSGVCILLAAIGVFPNAGSAQGQEAPQNGQLQGMFLDSGGSPMNGSNCTIRVFLGGQQLNIRPRFEAGGLYRIDLKPEIYEAIFSSGLDNRPQRILGVVVNAGEVVRLDVTLKPGRRMDVVGKPLINIPPAIIVSEALEKFQKQIDDLKKENSELRAEIVKLKSR
ncbi:MAG: carboxypeptidase-like regulatory domain-containing protein [Planctomycetota bacterium]